MIHLTVMLVIVVLAALVSVGLEILIVVVVFETVVAGDSVVVFVDIIVVVVGVTILLDFRACVRNLDLRVHLFAFLAGRGP